MKFKVLEGRHQVFVKRELTDENGRKRTVSEVRSYPKESIVESDVDLAARFNRPNAKKFELVPDSAVAVVESPSSPGEELENMTVAELRELAQASNINLGAAKTKAEILALMRDHLA